MDADDLSHILRGEYNQHIETDSVSAPILQVAQGITLIEAYSCNIWITEILDIQKDSKGMLIEE